MNFRFLAVVLLIICLATSTAAQIPTVVTTLPPSPNSASTAASEFVAAGSAVYFYADTGLSAGIWKWTDAEGAQLVKAVGRSQNNPAVELMAFGSGILFSAQGDGRGTELWLSDGSPAGTYLVKEIYVAGSSVPRLLATSGAKAWFTAYDPEHGRELWVTDGTESGTTLVADLGANATSSSIQGATAAGGKLYFVEQDQLWVSDGTAPGTLTLASGVNPSSLGILAGKVFFLGFDEANGRELWSTDGTLAGTALVKDINPGPASSWGGLPTQFVQVGSSLIFFSEDADGGREPWITDGTAAGTQRLHDITPGAMSTALENLVATATGAFFVVNGTDLWFSNGTPAGTTLVATYPGVAELAGATGGAFVSTNDSRLVFSDGTPGGTIEIANATVASRGLRAVGARAAFVGRDEFGAEPWISDGTDAGTRAMGNLSTGSLYGFRWMVPAGAQMFFEFENRVYRSDGAEAGTIPLADMAATYSWPQPVALQSSLLFHGKSEDGAPGLWKSDGSVSGTTEIIPFSDIERFLPPTQTYALFVGSESHYCCYPETWVTDGSAAGTRRLLTTEAVASVEIADRVYILARRSNYSTSTQLWVTRGTEETTKLLLTGQFGGIGAGGGALFLSGGSAETGMELHRSDGSVDGTELVLDIAPGTTSSSPEDFVGAGNLIFFTADDDAHGRELWRSDGTPAGTFQLRDIWAGQGSSNVSDLVASGAYVYFTANDGANGRQIWRTDGSVVGTMRLTEIASASRLTAFDAGLIAVASDESVGTELWQSDGSIAGTFVAWDLEPGPSSSSPRNLAVARDHLFFGTGDARLWKFERSASRVYVGDRRATEGGTTLQFTVTREGDLTGGSSVTWATSDLTATAGADYVAASGTLVFAAGEASRQIAVTILGDAAIERNEIFALVLTGATGTTIVDDRAFGIIDDDDRRASLTIEYVPHANSYRNRVFRIRNAGPSGTSVTVRLTESPFEGGFSCDDGNPSDCYVGLVPAGGVVEFAAERSDFRGRSSATIVPGHTLTATLLSDEVDLDPSDNTIVRMINRRGNLSLPYPLVAGTTVTADVSTSGYFPDTIQLALSGGVVVSPGSVTVTETSPIATLSLTVAPNAWGWSTVTEGAQTQMRIPITLAGEQTPLDTTIVVPDYYQLSFDHDEPVVIPVRVAAMLPDGTRPSGTIDLLRVSDGVLMQRLVLDANGDATFTLNGVAVGEHFYRLAYGGDAYFNPLTIDLPEVNVRGWSTFTRLTIVQHPCGEAELVATVSNYEGHTPTGLVDFFVGYTRIASVSLVPTDTAGYAEARARHSFSSNYASVEAEYVPEPPFIASQDWSYGSLSTCPAPTLIASASGATSVSLTWSDVGATQYEVVRSEAPSRNVFVSVGTTSATSMLDTSVAAGTAYLYRVRAKDGAGSIRSESLVDLALTVLFTDDPVVLRTTPIKAVHINELQQAANIVRTLAGLPAVNMTPVQPGSLVNPAEIHSLRSAIEEALPIVGQPGVTWAEGVSAGKPVKGVHFQQMRNVLK